MILAALLALAVDPEAPAAISFAPGPCFGSCPAYSARVSADGSGLFGDRSAPPRRFTITPEQFRAFAAHLAPLARVSCPRFMSEVQAIDIVWTGADGSRLERRYYQRCLERDHPALAPRLRDAPAMLPIGDLIRREP